MLAKLLISLCVHLVLNIGDIVKGEVVKNETSPLNSSSTQVTCLTAEMEDDKAHSVLTIRYKVPICTNLTEYVKSPPCDVHGLPWKIVIRKVAPADDKQNKHLGVYVEYNMKNSTSDWSCNVTAELRLISHKLDEKPYSMEYNIIFNRTNADWGWEKYIAWNKIVDPQNEYVKDDAFTLEAHIKPYCVYLDSTKQKRYTESKKYRFDYEYYKQIDGWLKHHAVPATWHDAWLTCQLEGAELASPINDAMLSVMNASIQANTWTGVHALFSKGQYFSVGGVSLLRMPVQWAPGEPDNCDNGEDCIVMLDNGTLADVPCSQVFPYSCYKKKTPSIKNFCGTLDPDYTYDYKTYSCYKFHNEARTWHRAFLTCAAEGGHLAVVNTPAEAHFLKELFAKYPKQKIFGAGSLLHDEIFIGVQDWGEAGIWTTIHGEPLDKLRDAGVATWAAGEPGDHALGGAQACAALRRDGFLASHRCHIEAPFICEKSPDSLEENYYNQF